MNALGFLSGLYSVAVTILFSSGPGRASLALHPTW
jgi:hypothetical protein